MHSIVKLIKIARLLGAYSLLNFIFHKISLFFGVVKALTPSGDELIAPCFVGNASRGKEILSDFELRMLPVIEDLESGFFKMFHFERTYLGSPPRWFFYSEYETKAHWTAIPVNTIKGNDVKKPWEISRLHWLQLYIVGYKVTGDNKWLDLANCWLADWCRKNPINCSVNWVCAQECSIRLINFINCSEIVKVDALAASIDFVVAHCSRIEPTLRYAISQDNNHATSEAAALYIGGLWLQAHCTNDSKRMKLSRRWLNKGRRVLEERVQTLVFDDGGFSMYSTNYHRVVLNTLSIVEFYRSKYDSKKFSDEFYVKCNNMIHWLFRLIDINTGRVVNLGANDGSNPFLIQSSCYSDFRPSLQFSSVIFNNELVFKSSDANESLYWFGVNFLDKPYSKTLTYEVPSIFNFPNTGMSVLNVNLNALKYCKLVVKYPVYLFRPSQCDLLHLDMWINGENILKDGGSFSYNSLGTVAEDFSSMNNHNTVFIDGTEPMPRISKFLLSSWRHMDYFLLQSHAEQVHWSGGYTDINSACHTRDVKVINSTVSVIDTVTNAKDFFVLSWRLCDRAWELHENTLICDDISIEVQSSSPCSIILESGLESKFYNTIQTIPVLKITCNASSSILITKFIIGA